MAGGVFSPTVFSPTVFATGGAAPASSVSATMQLAGQGLYKKKRRREDDLSYEEWLAFAEFREKLAEMDAQRKAPAKLVREVQKTARRVVEKVGVTPDVYAPPPLGASVAVVATGIDQLLDYMARIDAMEARAREAWEQQMRDDEEAAAMLLLH